MKKTIALLITVIFSSLTFAQQQNITDDELSKFADAYQQVRMINQSSQQKMMKAVTDEDLTVQRFNLINQAELNPDKEVEATEEELESYQVAIEAVETIQENVQAQLQTKIKETGLTLERFQQIANQLKSDKELQQRLSNLMQG
jgi:hypothetical protein